MTISATDSRARAPGTIASTTAALALPALLALSSPATAQQNRGFPDELDRLGVERGDPDAPLVVREFADYQCPACRSFYPTVKRLIDEYVDAGQVRFVFFDFPLDMHEHAVPAAEAARCAGRQNAYWAMHDALFENQGDWSEASDPVERFAAYAEQLELDAETLTRCIENGTTREVVMQNRALAGRLGVRSTPSMLIGQTGLSGVASWERVQQTVEAELGGESPRQRQPPAAAEPLDPDRELQTVETNRLSDASSPYLQLHSDNPVDWYPWGEEAFEKAREENKPVFLSIGYFTCYWCHVMERESFADAEVADILNRFFVSIKVDREQRPGVDSLYMRAVNVLGERGGWPLSMFLTPDRKPFFGGTYYPKPQFINALNQLRGVWENQPERIERAADQVLTALKQTERAAGVDGSGEIPGPGIAEAAESALARRFDAELGGFGNAPKFPQPSVLMFLLDRSQTGDSEHALEMALTTLDAMADGGIHDHLGGGFHRYSVDGRWHVPHFEKMLYDNAQLLEVYSRAADITGDSRYRETVDAIVRYLDSTLTDPDTGLLYSAQSSLVDEEEGESYIWTPEQVRAALDDGRAFRVATLLYGLDGDPDLEGAHVLHRRRDYDDIVGKIESLDAGEVEAVHRQIDNALLAARDKREQAPVGTKHVMSWNAMTIRALAYAGRVFDEPDYTGRARATARAVIEHMYDAEGGPWLAIRAGHRPEVRAQSFDYAALTAALLELGRASGNGEWTERAARVASDMVGRLWNAERGLFDRREDSDLLVETTDLRDGAVPAGNSVAALALTELARAGHTRFAPYAATVMRAHAGVLDRSPASLPLMLTALGAYHETGLPTSAAIPDKQIAAQATAQAAGTTRSSPGLALDGVGGGTAVSGPGSTFSGDKVGMQVQRSGNRDLAIELHVDEGWHINANPASLEFLVPTQLHVQHDGRALEVETTYPESHEIPADALGEGPIDVYSGQVSIRARLPDSVASSDELAAVVEIQACNDKGRCLAPDELEQRVAALE